jgi:hypothetical protein
MVVGHVRQVNAALCKLIIRINTCTATEDNSSKEVMSQILVSVFCLIPTDLALGLDKHTSALNEQRRYFNPHQENISKSTRFN